MVPHTFSHTHLRSHASDGHLPAASGSSVAICSGRNQRHCMTPHTFPSQLPSALASLHFILFFLNSLFSHFSIDHKHLYFVQTACIKHRNMLSAMLNSVLIQFNFPLFLPFGCSSFFSAVFLSVFAVINRNPAALSFPLSLSHNLSSDDSFSLSPFHSVISSLNIWNQSISSSSFLLLPLLPFPSTCASFFKNTWVSKAFYLQFFNC